MQRRTFVSKTLTGYTLGWASCSLLRRLLADESPRGKGTPAERHARASRVLQQAVEAKQVAAATIFTRCGNQHQSSAFGTAQDEHAMFLLGSISKPIAVAALMTLYDRKAFELEDLASRYLPAFRGEGRERVTIRQLLTHVSGLPDQLPENAALRAKKASLAEFAEAAQRTPLSFAPGTKYQYSSMAILLAARIAEQLSGESIQSLVERAIFRPLGMTRSAQGRGAFQLDEFIPVQTERAAPEAGGGDPQAREWDWNSVYWRSLGAPWGGTHASAPDLGKLLAEFLHPTGAIMKSETLRLMIANHNLTGLTPRGLGWNVGAAAGARGCSEHTFGHTGSTGTLAWADPATDEICVILTSLPGRAAQPHPRELSTAEFNANRV